MAQYFTDFSEYTTGAIPSGWEEDYWSDISSTSFTVQEIPSISPQGGKVAQLRSTSYNERVGCAWIALGSISGDVDVYSRVRFTHSINQLGRIYICMGGGAVSTTDGYFINLSAQGNQAALVKYYNGTSANLSVINYSLNINIYYKIRLQKTGNTIRAKIWGDTSLEPGTWNIGSITDSSNQAGYVGVGSFERLDSDEYVYWDVFGVGTGVDTAPQQANTPPTISVAPIVNYGATYGRLGTGNTPVYISFTATDTEETGTDQLLYEIRTEDDTLVGTGNCTSGIEKQHAINVSTSGLVNGNQTLYLTIFDEISYSETVSFTLNRDNISPTMGPVTYQHEYGE